jgi:alkanesulfonate monooxygenase SsuD/methylene tetrahydromethanopterin reductase-like flavin-dependent oxidoreductase (luciferase family)
MPTTALQRNHAQTLRENQEAVMLAHRLGFHHVFIGELLTDATENVTNAMMLLAPLIHATKSIKLGTATCLSQNHPTPIAVPPAMPDHLPEALPS